MNAETNNWVPAFFYVLVRYSLLFSSEIILKQLFASGSLNVVIQCDNQSFFSIGKLLSYINSWDKNWENYALWFQLFICIFFLITSVSDTELTIKNQLLNQKSSFSFNLLCEVWGHRPWLLRLWGWYFFHVHPGHWVPTSVSIGSSVTGTVTDPESHSHDTSSDFHTDALNVSYTEQILFAASSLYHVNHAINRSWRRAFLLVKGEIPSLAATMTVGYAKNTIPEDVQASFVWCFVEDTFLRKF